MVTASDKTDVGVMDTKRVAAKITKIDTKNSSVTLMGPSGGTITVEAKDPANPAGLKVVTTST